MERSVFLRGLSAGVAGASVCALVPLAARAADHGSAPHWTYGDGEDGPAHWGDLAPDFHTCSIGLQQSPVNISDVATGAIGDIQRAYHASPLRIINNGHTIQVNYAAGSTLTLRGRTWEIIQFHFHTPSEHTYQGAHYDMELHIVHQNAAKQLCVLGVFMKAGTANAEIQKIWDAMPMQAGSEQTVSGVSVDVGALVPATKVYYNYLGSLTTPPCSENVEWLVLRDPIQVSAAQIARFKAAIPMNARPVQPVNQRFIIENV
jgi:carbonic anhydrase